MGYQISYDANIGAIVEALTTTGIAVVTGNHGITGAYAYRQVSRTGGHIICPFVTPTTSPAISLWFKFAHNTYIDGNAGDFRLRFKTTTGHYIEARWNTLTRSFDIYVDGSLVASGTPSTVYGINELFNARFYGTIGASGGLTAKVNGLEVVTYSGNTLPSGSDPEVEELIVYGTAPDPFFNTLWWYASSISLNDGGGDPGDRRCQVLMPNTDDSVQWTPSTGSNNYATVNQVPPSDASYNTADANGEKDLLGLTDFDEGGGVTIAGITKFARAWKTTADEQSLRNGVSSNATEDYTEEILSQTARYYMHVAELNPDDSAPWEDADIDSLLAMQEALIP